MKCVLHVLAIGLVLVVASVVASVSGSAATGPVPTFTKDIAPILYARCVTCHRPGEMAPVPLLTYAQTRPWAKAIQQKVVKREMPPWHADPRYGKFANDRSLTPQEIDTIVAWVAGGAPEGNVTEMPAVPQFAEGWTPGREPDYVFEMPHEYSVPAEGQSFRLNFWVPIPFEEDRFAEWLELRPGNRSAVHHITVLIADLPPDGKLTEGGELIYADGTRENDSESPDTSKRLARIRTSDRAAVAENGQPVVNYLPGHSFEPHSPGTGVRIPKGKYVRFDVHYQATGRPETDRSRLGLWFSKASNSEVQEVFQTSAGGHLATSVDTARFNRAEGSQLDGAQGLRSTFPTIPPFAKSYTVVGVTPITEPITLTGFWPHMHLRGKEMKWILTRPDGRQEILLSVPHYDFNWQLQYDLREPLPVPTGSTITGIARWDNSPENKYNPAPDKEVFWSFQSWDEMYSAYFVYTVDSHKSFQKTQ